MLGNLFGNIDEITNFHRNTVLSSMNQLNAEIQQPRPAFLCHFANPDAHRGFHLQIPFDAAVTLHDRLATHLHVHCRLLPVFQADGDGKHEKHPQHP